MRTGSDDNSQTGQTDTFQAKAPGHNGSSGRGKVIVIGLGPGDRDFMSVRAIEALRESGIIVGYKTYVDLIAHLITPEQQVISSAMTREVERSRQAVELALQGNTVAVVSSGDPGVYGMAGILLEIVNDMKAEEQVAVEIVPGISAANGAASSLGAPLMHDYVVISMSDLLTPWEIIKKRIECAAAGDFVVAVYNPKSKKRVEQVKVLQQIMLEYKSPETPVGIVTNAKRGAAEVVNISTLANFTDEFIDMFSVVIIGNSQTYVKNGKMITPRGYKI